MFLPKDTFKTIVSNTPLVSIDFIIKNSSGQILLGRRKNPPAKNYWFVPGGRIQKNESLSLAFKRLTKQEIGVEFSITQASLLGPFDHFYSDSIFGEEISTHYVAIAYSLDAIHLPSLPDQQHSEYHWFSISDIHHGLDIHKNTKAYFKDA